MDLVRSRAILRPAVTAKYRAGARESTLVELLVPDRDSNRTEAAVDELRRLIDVSVVRSTGVVQLSVSTENPALSEQIAQRLVELLHAFNVQIRQANAREEARFVGARLAEALADMGAAEDKLEEFLRRNREFRNSPELTSRHERLQREVAMRQQLYMSLQNSQEQARIDAFRDTPLITVIDHPAGSAKPQSRGTVTRVFLAALLGVVFAIVVILLKEFIRRGREARNPKFEEFEGLARAAWADLSRPARRSKGK
jgi:tyrosine-protein kinase Etk/Wzc